MDLIIRDNLYYDYTYDKVSLLSIDDKGSVLVGLITYPSKYQRGEYEKVYIKIP